MATTLMGLIAENMYFITSLLLNIVFFFIFLRLRVVLGPFLQQSLKVAFNRMKDPNLFIHFLNSKTAILEWRTYNQVVKLDPEEPTSELVYADRENGFTPMTPQPTQSRGFFNIFNKGVTTEKLNTIYTDDFIPVRINPTKNYWLFGRQMHVIYEGQNITQNPLANFTQDAQVKKAGIAVEHQLLANKLLAESEFRNKIATKDDVRNWGILQLVILGLIGVASIVMVMGLQDSLTKFADFATKTFDTYKPIIEKAMSDIPKVIVNG